MFPGRFYLGIGAGEALNEHIVASTGPSAGAAGDPGRQSVEIIRKLFTGKKAKLRGDTSTWRARDSTRCPARRRLSTWRPPARSTPSAPGEVTDGIITVGAADEKMRMLLERYKGASDAGKDPATMRSILSCMCRGPRPIEAATKPQCASGRTAAWPFPKADIREPEDFEAMAKIVRAENLQGRVLHVTPDLDEHAPISSTSSTWASASLRRTTLAATRSRSSDSTAGR